MVRNWANKNFKGFAYVDYRDLGSVKKAIDKYHGKPYRGRNLILDAVTTDQKRDSEDTTQIIIRNKTRTIDFDKLS